MNRQFESHFHRLEANRAETASRFASLSDEHWNFSSQPGKWSIAQILTHLVTSEQLSLGYMKKKAQAIEQVGNSGLWESSKILILIISQRLPLLKFKAPRVVIERTPPALSQKELFETWEKLRADLNHFLGGISEAHARKLIYKHPVAGRLDARQALIFFGEHIRHHRPQLMRLLRKK